MTGSVFVISSSEKGILESSSRSIEKLVAIFDSSRTADFKLDVNSAEIVLVPFTSSQYILTIRSSCCMLRAGHTSVRISLNVLIGLREIT
jgi:hypothetical protein